MILLLMFLNFMEPGDASCAISRMDSIISLLIIGHDNFECILIYFSFNEIMHLNISHVRYGVGSTGYVAVKYSGNRGTERLPFHVRTHVAKVVYHV
jgi:hypothetical protein